MRSFKDKLVVFLATKMEVIRDTDEVKSIQQIEELYYNQRQRLTGLQK